MNSSTRYRHVWASMLALLFPGAISQSAWASGNNFASATPIELNQRYNGTLPVGQGRHCYRLNVPQGEQVTILGSNNYDLVFVSAYTGQGQVMIGETQILSSFQSQSQVTTEATDGTVMVCVDSDSLARGDRSHQYSLQVALGRVSLLGKTPPPAAALPVVPAPKAVANPRVPLAVPPAPLRETPPTATPQPIAPRPKSQRWARRSSTPRSNILAPAEARAYVPSARPVTTQVYQLPPIAPPVRSKVVVR